jgi:hypothetical protein
MAMIGSAMTVRSVQYLTLTRADIARARHEAALDGGHFEAAAEIIRSGVAGPYHWTLNTDLGLMDVVAEPETDKLSLQAASTLSDADLAGLGIQDPSAFRARTTAEAKAGAAVAIGSLDPAPLWRACGASVISPLGQQQSFVFQARQKPGPSPNPASWHIGEAWRVYVATSDGWSDDRIVRFTGDAQQPAAVVTRNLRKDGDSGGSCDDLLGKLFSAS